MGKTLVSQGKLRFLNIFCSSNYVEVRHKERKAHSIELGVGLSLHLLNWVIPGEIYLVIL